MDVLSSYINFRILAWVIQAYFWILYILCKIGIRPCSLYDGRRENNERNFAIKHRCTCGNTEKFGLRFSVYDSLRFRIWMFYGDAIIFRVLAWVIRAYLWILYVFRKIGISTCSLYDGRSENDERNFAIKQWCACGNAEKFGLRSSIRYVLELGRFIELRLLLEYLPG